MSTTREDKTYFSQHKTFNDNLQPTQEGRPIMDQISEGLSNVAETTKETLSGAAEAVQEGLIGAKEAVFGKADDTRASVHVAEDKVKEKADKTKFHEESGIRSRSEKLADKTENIADKAAKNIQKFGEKAADTVEHIGRGDKTREKEREKDFEKNVKRFNEPRECREKQKGLLEQAGEKVEEWGQRMQGEAH